MMKRRFPDQVTGYTGFARIADLRRQWETGIERWDEAVEKFPSNMQIAREKLRLLIHWAEFEAAGRYLEVCNSQFDPKYFISEKFNFHKKQHDLERLARVVEEALTLQDVTVEFSGMIKQLYRNHSYQGHAERLLLHAFKLHGTQHGGDPVELLKLQAYECEMLILKKEYPLAIDKIHQLEQKMEHEPDLRHRVYDIWL